MKGELGEKIASVDQEIKDLKKAKMKQDFVLATRQAQLAKSVSAFVFLLLPDLFQITSTLTTVVGSLCRAKEMEVALAHKVTTLELFRRTIGFKMSVLANKHKTAAEQLLIASAQLKTALEERVCLCVCVYII